MQDSTKESAQRGSERGRDIADRVAWILSSERLADATPEAVEDVAIALCHDLVHYAGLIAQALDSHAYWQLSETHYRDSGYVRPPGSDDPDTAEEIRETERLQDIFAKLTAEPWRTSAKEGR